MDPFEKAQYFVGNVGEDYFKVGALQLELLKRNGCRPQHNVLEIGCGCLVAWRPILQFLEPGRYVGIEPNEWLIEAALEGLPDIGALIGEKHPIFLSNSDFDAREAGVIFDFVISHSVLSHAAHWQCPQFFEGIKTVLAPSGVAIASLRFYDQDHRLMGDSESPEWVYPEVSYFAWETIQKFAAEHGLRVEWRQDYRDFFTAEAPTNYHDWIRLTHSSSTEHGHPIGVSDVRP
jgi:SAM-dependent methyltransferase